MKHFKRTNTYKASNVEYQVDTMAAYSYDWWQFTKVINGKLVFNNHYYSSSTCKHLSKVRSLLRELDIKIDILVDARCGLQNSDWTDQARESIKSKITEIEKQLNNKRRHKKLDQTRLESIESFTQELNKLESFLSENNL